MTLSAKSLTVIDFQNEGRIMRKGNDMMCF